MDFNRIDGDVGVSLSSYMEAFHIDAKKLKSKTTILMHIEMI